MRDRKSLFWTLTRVPPLGIRMLAILFEFERRSRERNGKEKIEEFDSRLRRSFSRLRRLHIHRAPTKPPATQARHMIKILVRNSSLTVNYTRDF